MALDENYKWAFVGTPNRKFGWVLTRTQNLYPQEVQTIREAMLAQGYRPCVFVSKGHSTPTPRTELATPFCKP